MGVFEAIQSGKLSMRPRWHFVLRTVLLILGIVLVLLTTLSLVSFVIFALRESGLWFVPIFGSRGWLEFFASLPWILIVAAILFIIVLEILVRRFSFGNHQPLLYTALGIILGVVALGVIIAPLHKEFLKDAYGDVGLPVVGGLYRSFGASNLSNTHVGVIFETTDDGFILENRNSQKLHVVVSSQTHFPFGTEFSEGDVVVVLGDWDDDTVQAFGVREINNELGSSTMRMPWPQGRRMMRFQITP